MYEFNEKTSDEKLVFSLSRKFKNSRSLIVLIGSFRKELHSAMHSCRVESFLSSSNTTKGDCRSLTMSFIECSALHNLSIKKASYIAAESNSVNPVLAELTRGLIDKSSYRLSTLVSFASAFSSFSLYKFLSGVRMPI